MKVFNLLALIYAYAGCSILGLCVLSEHFFGDSAKFVVVPFALLLGLTARRTVEKILGYTLIEALKEGSNGQN